jgi:hypothetical protein
MWETREEGAAGENWIMEYQPIEHPWPAVPNRAGTLCDTLFCLFPRFLEYHLPWVKARLGR